MGSAIKRVANYAISDTAFGTSWDGVTDVAPSKNAVYDEMELRAPKANPTFSGLITSAGQIKFPASQSASADVNTLDDYEEGRATGTPSALTGTFTSASYDVRYTKIGRLVSISAVIVITTVGSAAGGVVIPLPFQSSASACLSGREVAATGKMCSGVIFGTGSVATIFNYDNSSPIGAGYSIHMSGVYFT